MGKNMSKALDVELADNDAGAPNVRCYLATLLEALLVEEEGFSGKRPFGSSGWLYDITQPLKAEGFDTSSEGFFTDLVNELCGVENEE